MCFVGFFILFGIVIDYFIDFFYYVVVFFGLISVFFIGVVDFYIGYDCQIIMDLVVVYEVVLYFLKG